MNTTATPLTAPQREQLRVLLAQRQEQLLAELGEVQRDTLAVARAAGSAEAEPPGSPRDQANNLASSTVRDAEAARDHAELVAVRAALTRMADGSYGECTDCGQSVCAARLQAQPHAARCIACQTQAEASVKLGA